VYLVACAKAGTLKNIKKVFYEDQRKMSAKPVKESLLFYRGFIFPQDTGRRCFQKSGNDYRIELRSGTSSDFPPGFFFRNCLPIRTVGGHGIESIGDCQNSGA
jgi:hypothetical protein